MAFDRLRLVFALLLLFLAVWVVVPGPVYLLFLLAVGAPEAGVWLIAAAAVTSLSARLGIARSHSTRLTLLACAATAMLAALPLLRFPRAAHRFDDAMRAALGHDYLCGVPAEARQAMRGRPLNPLELFTGLRSGPARVSRGIRFVVSDGVPLTMDIYRPERPSRPIGRSGVRRRLAAWCSRQRRRVRRVSGVARVRGLCDRLPACAAVAWPAHWPTCAPP